jgi:hypothetical protein
MAGFLLSREPLALQTRKKTTITNWLDRSPCPVGYGVKIAEYRKEYIGATHRPVGPCNTYNCQGLTFAARRTWIADSKTIKTIINDDDYRRIELRDVMAGDVVLYVVNNDVEHSGLVMQKEGLSIKILSKWGHCHEVIHELRHCPWFEAEIDFYRICT